MSFVHLQVTSAYSLLSGTMSIKELVTNAKEKGYQALALTDRNVLYGAALFYKECCKQGIKPIMGMTVDVISEEQPDQSFPLVLLAKNEVGFRHLMKISSAVQTKNKNGIPIKWLKYYATGLIAISPGKEGEIEQMLLAGEIDAAKKVVELWKNIFGPNQFYLSIQRHELVMEETLNNLIIQIATNENIKIVATNNVLYAVCDDHFAFECLTAIRDGKKISELETDEWHTDQYYLKGKEEMIEQFIDLPLALENTWRIAEICCFDMKTIHASLPKYPVPTKEQPHLFLEKICVEGLYARYQNPTTVHKQRLQYELEIIHTMGFDDYFLIVWDFMKFAREQEILTGPGRGSAAGSIVAYVLFITDADPIKYNLLFERFLNPERISLPDIDIDFPDVKRDRVIEYVRNKYGDLHVAQIVTFGTLAAKAVLRDVGRVFELSPSELDDLSRMIPPKLGITLKKSVEESPRLQAFIQASQRNKQLFETACKLEGLPRHTSTHAAGVVLSQEPLVEIVPIQNGHDNVYLTQYSMEFLEELGLLKMDFLGLRNLTLIESIINTIYRTTKQKMAIKDIPYNDPAVYRMLGSGETTGIFQLESDGMRNVLQQLQPSEFEDIVAVNALYRPGPMDNIPLYIRRKHGKEPIHYYHEDLEGILKNTYGVIIYQEQIIQIASKMAGFSLGEADLLRRAVSKKQKDILEKERIHFVHGAEKKGYSKKIANDIYELIVRFANYGFNRSHAVAYSMIAYQLAYLKSKYPTFFMATLLSTAIGNEGKITQYVQELKQMNIKLLPPSINKSFSFFRVEGECIRYSLSAIKGVGGSVVKEILQERKKKQFEDLFDFCLRVSSKIVNRKVMEALTYSGCFDEFGEDRATILATIDVAIQHAQFVHPEELDEVDLFEEMDFLLKPKYVEIAPLKLEEKLRLEKNVLGIYLSDHPVSSFHQYASVIKSVSISEMEIGMKCNALVYVTEVKMIRTKKGEPMAFLELSDQSGDMDAVAFPVVYKKHQHLLKKSEILLVEGKIEQRNGKKQFVIQLAYNMSEYVQSFLKKQHKLFIKVRNEKELEACKGEIISIIRQYPGSTPVLVHFKEVGKTILLQQEFQVSATAACIGKLTQLLGSNRVILTD